ncbi:MAG: flagellar biosynthetic protein FliR [Rickettsiales bacterium]
MHELLYRAAPEAVFGYFVLFCRMGAAFMAMPAIGESYFPVRVRLAFAVLCALCVYPGVAPILPKEPPLFSDAFLLLAHEIIAGVLIGYIVKIFHAVVHLSGSIISYQAGLTAAMLFDPSQASTGTVVGNFLGIATLALLFSANVHHLFIRAAAESYAAIPPGGVSDKADALVPALLDVASGAFRVAVSFSMPFMAVGLIGYLTLGIMGRLMPQMQVFFVVVPLQIVVVLGMVGMALVTLMPWLIDRYYELMENMV